MMEQFTELNQLKKVLWCTTKGERQQRAGEGEKNGLSGNSVVFSFAVDHYLELVAYRSGNKKGVTHLSFVLHYYKLL